MATAKRLATKSKKPGENRMPARLKELLRHGDFVSLLLLLIVIGCVWAFVEIADEVLEGELRQLDRGILLSLRNPANVTDPIGPRWFEELMRDATALGGILMLTLLVAAAVVVLWLEQHRRAALWLLIATLGAFALSSLFKLYFARERPDILATELLPPTYSFPSGHSMLSAAVYLTLGALLTHVVPRKRTRGFVLFMALLLTAFAGFSRVYLGVHYPSDVLAGWTLGLSWAALCWLVAWNMRKL